MSARLRIVVADDERPARSFLVALLRSFEDVVVVGEAESGKDAVAMIEKERPDLALLDWQMPELDGIGVVRMLKKQDMPLIAFVTAYDEYAVRAFEINAVDYLLKPVDKAACGRRSTARRNASSTPRSSRSRRRTSAPPSTRTRRPRSPLPRADSGSASRGRAHRPGESHRVDCGRGRAADHHDVRNERHTITYRLKDLEARLDPARFIGSAGGRSPTST